MGAFFHHMFRALSGYVQRWTKQNIPNDCQVLHDYGNGEGAVPSAPVDLSGVRNDIISTFKIPFYTEASSVRNDIIAMVHYPINYDTCGVSNDIIMVEQLQ